MRVPTDTPLHICAKAKCEGNIRFTYGYRGDGYRDIPD